MIAFVSAQNTRDPAYDNVCEVLLTRLSYGEQQNARLDHTTSQLEDENERLKQHVDGLELQLEEIKREFCHFFYSLALCFVHTRMGT